MLQILAAVEIFPHPQSNIILRLYYAGASPLLMEIHYSL